MTEPATPDSPATSSDTPDRVLVTLQGIKDLAIWVLHPEIANQLDPFDPLAKMSDMDLEAEEKAGRAAYFDSVMDAMDGVRTKGWTITNELWGNLY